MYIFTGHYAPLTLLSFVQPLIGILNVSENENSSSTVYDLKDQPLFSFYSLNENMCAQEQSHQFGGKHKQKHKVMLNAISNLLFFVKPIEEEEKTKTESS